MQSKATTIVEYVKSLSEEQRIVIELIDSIVRAVHPSMTGSMKFGMPTYEFGGRMFAFNAQKNYFSIYADPELVKRYKADLKGLDVGKSCIRFASSAAMPEKVIRRIVDDYRH